MGCGGSKATVTRHIDNKLVKRPPMKVGPENLQFYFRYEFKEGVDQETKEKVFACFTKLNDYFIAKGSWGPILLQLDFTRMENGWDANEIFQDGSVYAEHVKRFMESPYFGELMGYQEHFEEKEAWLKGLESEFAKAPQVAEFYPHLTPIHQAPYAKGDPRMFIGFKNEFDGMDHKKRGGPIVVEFDVRFTSPDQKPKVMAILEELMQVMKDGNEFGPVFSHLVFWHHEDGNGY